jgi:protein tyrosine/serine phosphatase
MLVPSINMKKSLSIGRVLFIILAIAVVGLGGRPQSAFSQKEAVLDELKKTIIHFNQVAPGVYRGGLGTKAGAPLLKELGVKTVINFDNQTKRAQDEAEYLKLFGIYTVLIPWSGWDQPTEENIEKFLALMRSEDLKPVMVHCKRGSERTGTMMAIWRISEFGWPIEKAYAEMREYEYRRFLQGHLKAYVYEYARKQGQDSAKISNVLEQAKTNFFYFFFQLRKLNPFRSAA